MSDIEPLLRLANPYTSAGSDNDSVSLIAAQLGEKRCTITNSAREQLQFLNTKTLASLRRLVWEEQSQGSNPRISTYTIESASSQRKIGFRRVSLDVLRSLRRRTRTLGSRVRVFDLNDQNDPRYEIATIMQVETGNQNTEFDDNQISFVLDYLREQGWIERSGGIDAVYVQITPSGQIFLDEQTEAVSRSEQAFVAMWFNDETNEAWADGIAPGVRDAGYTPMRIDQHHHENRIDDEIIAQIRVSRMLIADFTCPRTVNDIPVARGGVYFEAGFAMGLGIPIIWTVRQDMIEGLHFDTRQYPHIPWHEPSGLRSQLRDRIVAIVGRGPRT